MTAAAQITCICGHTRLEVADKPIVNVACCCNSCQSAGARLRLLPAAASVLESDGSTRFVLYRKDRVRVLKGSERLKEFRLTPQSKTRRVIATCCNTPVFLEFQGGHWLSLYSCLWPEGRLPALEMRTMTMDLPAGTVLPDDVPNARRQPISFMVKLLAAWVAMGFKAPKVAINGELHA
jgi:Family of unknown function (DUF6151)